MSAVFHAIAVFWDHLAAVHWTPLGLALGCHVVKILLRTTAWRNIVRAAYPGVRVPRRGVIGAYLAGVGVNAIVPARGGDALKLYLLKHRVEGSTYPTLASTLVVETLFDFVVALGLFVWALQLGVLPNLHVLQSVRSFDWSWVLRHPRLAFVLAGILALAALLLWLRLRRRVEEFKSRLAKGFAILGDRRRYLSQVVTWQAASWVFRIASVFFFLRAFSIPATVHNGLLVQVVQSLSTLLPFSPGGVGTEQGLTVYVLRGKASATALLSFSVGAHIALVVVNVVLGFGAIALMLRTLDWRRILERRGEVAAAHATADDPSQKGGGA